MFRLMLGRGTQTMARRKEGLSSTDICALLLFISQGKVVFTLLILDFCGVNLTRDNTSYQMVQFICLCDLSIVSPV